MNAYFIPGMCLNCKVFDNIQLPNGYEKKYIEWHVPENNEDLNTYARSMAKSIDTASPFILIGYSLGAIIMQEMNRFLKPEKNIILSSIKHKDERPPFIRIAGKTKIPKYIPEFLLTSNDTINYLFAHFIYDMTREEVEQCVTCTSPKYIKWAADQITKWTPTVHCENLYHIHGTNDQTFPFKLIKEAIAIEKGDHLMPLKKAEEVSKTIAEIIVQ
jgi:hypothetical protein